MKLMASTCQCSSSNSNKREEGEGGIWQNKSVLLLPTSSIAGCCSGLTACTAVELYTSEPPLITAVQCSVQTTKKQRSGAFHALLSPVFPCQEGVSFLLPSIPPSFKSCSVAQACVIAASGLQGCCGHAGLPLRLSRRPEDRDLFWAVDPTRFPYEPSHSCRHVMCLHYRGQLMGEKRG